MSNPQIISCGKIIAIHALDMKQPTAVYNPHRGLINCVNINHSNRVIASCGQDGKMFLVGSDKPENVVHQQPFNSEKQKNASVNCCMFSPNSTYIAAGSVDSIVKIWNLKNTKQPDSIFKTHLGNVTSLGWIKQLNGNSTNGEILASASTYGDICLHSLNTKSLLQTYNAKFQEAINAIRISESADHNRLAACTNGGSVLVWDLNSSNKDSGLICSFSNSNRANVTSLSFSSFNPVLLVTCSNDSNLVFYDVNEKRSVKVINAEQPLTAVNFHSNGHTLVTGGMYGGLFIYDLRNPKKYTEKLTGHQTAIKFLDFYKQAKIIEKRDLKDFTSSRASKMSSISSQSNGSNSYSQSQSSSGIQQRGLNEVKPNNNEIRPEIKQKVNNFMESQVKNVVTSDKQIQREKLPESKLSSTGQEVIKNAQNNQYSQQQERLASKSMQYQNLDFSGNDFNKTKPRQIQPREQAQTRQQVPAHNYNSQIPPAIDNSRHHNEILQVQKRIKSQMYQLFEGMHLELIKQFQIQGQEQRKMLEEMIFKDRKKDEKIKKLQEQIVRLKKNTF